MLAALKQLKLGYLVNFNSLAEFFYNVKTRKQFL